MTALAISQYEELVQRGREARQQADNMQWIEGDLALEIEALPANERPRDPATGEFLADEVKALKRYADDVDIPHSTLQQYRQTASAWPPNARAFGAPWSVHRVLVAQEDRFSLIHSGMTFRQAEKLVRERTAGASGKPGWLELLGKSADQLIDAGKTLAKLEAEIDARGDRAEVTDRMAERAERYRVLARDLADRYAALRDLA